MENFGTTEYASSMNDIKNKQIKYSDVVGSTIYYAIRLLYIKKERLIKQV
jgi:hypothetical protein